MVVGMLVGSVKVGVVYVVESVPLLFFCSSPRVLVSRDGGISGGWLVWIVRESVEVDC